MMNRMSLLFRLSLAGPLTWWIWLAFQGGLGAEPIVKLNKNLGNFTLILIVVNLWLGVILRWRWLPNSFLPWVVRERRWIGIASGIYLFLHFVTYLGKESFEIKAFEMIATKFYLAMGFLAALCIWVLSLTSNNLSVRRLGGKNWKRLHRSIHFFSIAILLHIFLIEKADLVYLSLLTVPLIIFQTYRGLQGLYRAFSD